jgi:crotonobetainyl-CoA:carnitine CoA-transferase CaiB-like acyl-CoA transferase
VGGRGVRCGVSIADMTAGMNAAVAILMALHARGRSGRGQYLDISMLEGQLGLLDAAIATYRADGVVPPPMGTAYRALLPYQTFRTRTEDLAIAVGSDSLWKTFCPLMGLAHLTNDPRYRSNADRNRNRESLIALLEETFLTRTYAEWEAILLPAGIPMGRINTIDRVVEHPQARARGVFAQCEHPVAGPVSMVSPYFRLSQTPGGVRSAAPLLGQHTAEVLRDELGLGDEEIETLRREGAIGRGPSGRSVDGGA